jgi:hypothetical protein
LDKLEDGWGVLRIILQFATMQQESKVPLHFKTHKKEIKTMAKRINNGV